MRGAVLYGDRVRLLCPMSDDAVEMGEYRLMNEFFGGQVELNALDSWYAQQDARGD